MAWESLKSGSTRFASLPLVIAGPILRKVDSNSVTVWLALSKDLTDVNLDIYDSINKTFLSNEVVFTGNTKPFKLGNNLYVVVITAKALTGSSLVLEDAKTYHYKVTFNSSTYINKTLSDPGILSPSGGMGMICYGAELLPSFSLPPSSDLGKLNIVHGSCRKPHGGRFDALACLGKLIEPNINNPLERPHQLFLTGDQIYADDVSSMLLFLLIDAYDALLGNQEIPPKDIAEVSPDLLNYPNPGERAELVKKGGLSAEGIGGSHLMALGEFYAMYLFVWSDVLWPGDDDFPSNSLVSSIKASDYKKEVETLIQFKNTLVNVRKALANIPTFMMCDDHEITDDWFLNFDWTNRALNNKLGKRIIQNGLTAFTLFQAWANTPDRFDLPVSNLNPQTEGGQFLSQLEKLRDNPAENIDQTTSPFDNWKLLGNIIVPTINHNSTGSYLTGGLEYAFSLNFPLYQVIIFDTRNRREFPPVKQGKSNGKPAGLISVQSLNQQLVSKLSEKQASNKFTLVVSPAPIIGHPVIEEIVQPGLTMAIDAINFLRTVKNSSYTKTETGSENTDREGWVFNRKVFQNLLYQLSKFDKVVILSGDVHYAFSCKVDYWDRRTLPVKKASFVQLVSSSLKNEDSKTIFNAIRVSRIAENELLRKTPYAGWSTAGKHIKVDYTNNGIFLPNRLNKVPAIKKIINPSKVMILNTPDWRYRIQFINDGRVDSDRGVEAIALTEIPNSGIRKGKRDLITEQKIAVGRNNLGQISFDFSTPQKEEVVHNIWYNSSLKEPNSSNKFNNFTKHRVLIASPLNIDPISPNEEQWKNFDYGFPD
ncbi:metallophosphoesterase family protein [Adhaeribacter soli]|uniref:PhoD-like phosphatase metallophosphatase domain-containing protein n=1 Tax=Adhaeribacter soli TaxID=2607655 RepID=A0A5N1IXG5_9BACT|nr:hypothetical protein [Adhaeribacter soli]KAA9338974.1 hypothetical protein F0P94_09290 [Adhaeribacter soli]